MASIKKYNGSSFENAAIRKYSTASEIITPTTTIYTDGTAISTYTIKGNTVQNGTPTPSNPVAVVGVGELETTGEHSGEYKIPILTNQQTIEIYIGDLPLLKSLDGTAVDEISNGILTRRVDSDGSVLPTPTTTQITMPSIPTTEGANSITVDTTVQPSEFTATWTGWHNAYVKEKSENLFDKDNADTQNIYVYTDDTNVHYNQNTVSVVFPCLPSTTYTISKTISSRFAVGYTNAYPQNGTRAYSINANDTATTLSITTGSNAEYIIIFIAYTPQETKTTQEILSSMMINEGQTALPYEPYWK